MNETTQESGASAGSRLMVYEMRYYKDWPGPWYGAHPGELAAKVRKHKPVSIIRIQ